MIHSSGSSQVPVWSLLVQPLVVKATFLGLGIARWGWLMKVPWDREHLFCLFSKLVSALLTLSVSAPWVRKVLIWVIFCALCWECWELSYEAHFLRWHKARSYRVWTTLCCWVEGWDMVCLIPFCEGIVA